MTQNRRLAVSAGIAAIAFIGGYFVGQSRQPTYRETRLDYLLTAIRSAGPVDTVILGDSIGESVAWDCGRTFNTSVGGAKIADAARLAPLIGRHLRPKTTVVEIGANHFWNGPDPDFADDYLKLVRSIGGRLVLVGVPNSAEASAFIRSTAAEIGATYVEPAVGELTTDGVHPNEAGAAMLRQRAAEGCR